MSYLMRYNAGLILNRELYSQQFKPVSVAV